MRMIRFLPLLVTAVVFLPLHVTAGTTSGGQLRLSPDRGAAGTHFTATFTFSVSRCDLYSVGLWWDDPHYTTPLGAGEDRSSGQLCQVSIDAVVPADHASPGTTYPVHAYTSPRGASVDGGPGPSGASAFAVTEPQSTGGGGAPTTTSAAATAQPGPTGGTAGNTSTDARAQSSAAAQAASAADAGAAAASASSPPSDGTAALASPAPDQTAPPTGSQVPAVIPKGPANPMGWISVAAIAGVLLAGALAWAYRSGRLRSLIR
jgi:hypothetical protein